MPNYKDAFHGLYAEAEAKRMRSQPDTDNDAKKRKKLVKFRKTPTNARRLFSSIKASSTSRSGKKWPVRSVTLEKSPSSVPSASPQFKHQQSVQNCYNTNVPVSPTQDILLMSTPVQSPLSVTSFINKTTTPDLQHNFLSPRSNTLVQHPASATGLEMAVTYTDEVMTDNGGQDGLSYLIDVNKFPERFAERFQKLEVEQREIRKELKQINERQTKFEVAMTGYMDQLTSMIPQLIAKMEALGSGNSTSAATKSRIESTFQPIDTEAELMELNEKAKSSDFIDQTIESLGQTCGKDMMSDGRDAGYAVVDQFATRKFWTTCTWTGTSGAENPKFCLSKYTAFINLIEEVIRFSTPSWTKIQNHQFLIKSILGNSAARYKRDKQLKASRSRSCGSNKNVFGDTPEEDTAE